MLRKSTTPKECKAVERMTRGNGREGARMDSKEKEKNIFSFQKNFPEKTTQVFFTRLYKTYQTTTEALQ